MQTKSAGSRRKRNKKERKEFFCKESTVSRVRTEARSQAHRAFAVIRTAEER